MCKNLRVEQAHEASSSSESPTLERTAQSAAAGYVAEFHSAFGLAFETEVQDAVPERLAALRTSLLREETEEFAQAAAASDIVEVADALADVVYIAYGSALTYGIDLDAVIREVHRSNMSKLGPDGRPVMREDGKVLKGDDYSPPDIAAVLAAQPRTSTS